MAFQHTFLALLEIPHMWCFSIHTSTIKYRIVKKWFSGVLCNFAIFTFLRIWLDWRALVKLCIPNIGKQIGLYFFRQFSFFSSEFSYFLKKKKEIFWDFWIFWIFFRGLLFFLNRFLGFFGIFLKLFLFFLRLFEFFRIFLNFFFIFIFLYILGGGFLDYLKVTKVSTKQYGRNYWTTKMA